MTSSSGVRCSTFLRHPASPATPASRRRRSPAEGRQERSALAIGALGPSTAQLPAVRGGAAL
eukprot:11505272-Alexandrium_andersonii.AAC.1